MRENSVFFKRYIWFKNFNKTRLHVYSFEISYICVCFMSKYFSPLLSGVKSDLVYEKEKFRYSANKIAF